MTIVIVFTSEVYARAVTEVVGGVETGIKSDRQNAKGKHVIEVNIYSSYSITTTKVYNNSGGTDATSGWINVSDYSIKPIFHIDLDTLNSTNVIVVAEGLISDDTTSPMTLFTKTFTAVDTDYALPICESVKYIRLSAQATGAGSNSISAKFRAEGWH